MIKKTMLETTAGEKPLFLHHLIILPPRCFAANVASVQPLQITQRFAFLVFQFDFFHLNRVESRGIM